MAPLAGSDHFSYQKLFEDPVFAAYFFYAVIVIAKMTFVQWWTTVVRLGNKTPSLPEDYKPPKTEDGKEKKGYSDLEGRVSMPVNRVRRLHLNDMENIPLFLIFSFFYVLTGPSPVVAIWHFRLFALGRVLHTIAYLLALQPHRTIFYMIAHTPYVSILGQLAYFAVQL